MVKIINLKLIINMDSLNTDVFEEIFLYLNMRDILSLVVTNKRNFDIIKKLKIYSDWKSINNNEYVIGNNLHYNLLDHYSKKLINEIKSYCIPLIDNEWSTDSDSDGDESILLSGDLKDKLKYFVKIFCTQHNTIPFGEFLNGIMEYVICSEDDIIKIISITLSKYCHNIKYFEIIITHKKYFECSINHDSIMARHCKNSDILKEYQKLKYPIDFSINTITNLCKWKNIALLKIIFDTEGLHIHIGKIINTIISQNSIYNINNNIHIRYLPIKKSNLVNTTIFITTLFDLIDTNNILLDRYRNKLFSIACCNKDIEYIKNVFNKSLISNIYDVILGLKISMYRRGIFSELFLFLKQYLRTNDLSNILEYAIHSNKIDIVTLIKKTCYDELKIYYTNTDKKIILDKIKHIDYFYRIYDLFDYDVGYPIFLQYNIGQVKYKINYCKYSKGFIHKLLSKINFANTNKIEHLGILKLACLHKNYYILTKYNKYDDSKMEKNNNLIELIIYLKSINSSIDVIVNVCKMVK